MLKRLYFAGRPRSQSSSYCRSSESVSGYKQKPSAHLLALPKTAKGGGARLSQESPPGPISGPPTSPSISRSQSFVPPLRILPTRRRQPRPPLRVLIPTRHAYAYRAGRQWHSERCRSTRHGTGLFYFIMAAARHSTLDFMLSATGEAPRSGDSPSLAYPPTPGCPTGPQLFFLPFLSRWGEERSERLAGSLLQRESRPPKGLCSK